MATETIELNTDEDVQAALDGLQNSTLAQRMQQRQTLLESETERMQWMDRAREVIQYARSDLLDRLDQDQPLKGVSATRHMYTSRPTTDLERAADLFCGNVFTADGWFGLEMADPRLSGKQPIRKLAAIVDKLRDWLQACEQHMCDIYAGSNFSATMPCLAMDSLSIGDSIMYVGNDTDEDMPFFEYRHPLSLWWKRDRYGKLMMVHEKISMTAFEAYQRWGNRVSRAVKLDAIRNPFQIHTFLHGVYRSTQVRRSRDGRDKVIPGDPILAGLRFAKPRPFIEIVIEKGAVENSGANNRAYEGGLDKMGGVIAQEGYRVMPYCDWPYWLKGDETHGRGPLGSAIYTVKRCHAEHKQTMLAGQKSVNPSMLASGTLRGKIDLSPSNAAGGGITYMEDLERDVMKEAQPNLRYPFGVDLLDRTEREISDVLNLDFFQMMSMTTKQMTIPEVIEKVGEKAAGLAPRIGLLQYLLLNQMHARVWDIEMTLRRLPTPPDVLYELAYQYGFDVSVAVRYKGPLSQIQQQVFLQRRISGAFQMLQPFVQLDPDAVRAKIDCAAATERVLTASDFPQDALRSDEQFQQIRQSQTQSAQALQASIVARNTADAQRKMASARKEQVRTEKEMQQA